MRVRLFEFGDMTWLPALLRDYATDYLETLFTRTGIYATVTPLLLDLLKRTGQCEITDFCSGAGGPMLALAPPLSEEVEGLRIRLTDKWPNRDAFARVTSLSQGVISAEPGSVDVFDPPANLAGVRTMFDALHHFDPEDARRIFAVAAEARAPIAVFDGANRTAAMIVGAVFIPILVLLLTPLVRPFRWSRLLLTYLIPVLPLVIFWDGLVSHMRAHSTAELEQITAGLGEGYAFEVGQLPAGPGGAISYVIGRPA